MAQAIGSELTHLRRTAKLSQQRLADCIGYDVTHVRQTEMGGNPTVQYLEAIAAYFRLKVSELFLRAESRLSGSK